MAEGEAAAGLFGRALAYTDGVAETHYKGAIESLNEELPLGTLTQFLIDDLVPGVGEAGRVVTTGISGGAALLVAGGIYEGNKLYKWDKAIRSANLAEHQKRILEDAAQGVLDLEELEGVVEVKFSRFPFGVDKDGKIDLDKNVLKIDFGRLKNRETEIHDRIRKSPNPHAVILEEAEKLLRISLTTSGITDVLKDLEGEDKTYAVHRYMATLQWIYEKLLKSAVVPQEMRMDDPAVAPELQREKLHPYYIKPRDDLLTESVGVARDSDKFIEAAEKFDPGSGKKLKLKAENRLWGGLDVEVDFSDYQPGGAKYSELVAMRSLLGFASLTEFKQDTARTNFVLEFTKAGGFMSEIAANALTPSDVFNRLPQGQRAAYFEALSLAVYRVFLKLVDPYEKAKEFFEADGAGIFVFKEGEKGKETTEVKVDPDFGKLAEAKREKTIKKERFPELYVLGDAMKTATTLYDQVYSNEEGSEGEVNAEELILGFNIGESISADSLHAKWLEIRKNMDKVYKALNAIHPNETAQTKADRDKVRARFSKMRDLIVDALMSRMKKTYFEGNKLIEEEAKLVEANFMIWRTYAVGNEWAQSDNHYPAASAAEIRHAVEQAWSGLPAADRDWIGTTSNIGEDLIAQSMAESLMLIKRKLEIQGDNRKSINENIAMAAKMRTLMVEMMGAESSPAMTPKVQSLESNVDLISTQVDNIRQAKEEYLTKANAFEFRISATTTPEQALKQYHDIIKIRGKVADANNNISAVYKRINDIKGVRTTPNTITVVDGNTIRRIDDPYPPNEKTISRIQSKFNSAEQQKSQVMDHTFTQIIQEQDQLLAMHRNFLQTRLNAVPFNRVPFHDDESINLGREFMANLAAYKSAHENPRIAGIISLDEPNRKLLFDALMAKPFITGLNGGNLREKLLFLSLNFSGRGVFSVEDVDALVSSIGILPLPPSPANPVIGNDKIGHAIMVTYLTEVIKGTLPVHSNGSIQDAGISLTFSQERYVNEIAA